MMPRLLDLFCGAGGGTAGYMRAGFDVVGVDIAPIKNHPAGSEFVQADALEYVTRYGHLFDAIHASPPCQQYSTVSGRARNAGTQYVGLVDETRQALKSTGKPYVIENVVGSPLLDPVRLCGSSFGLDLRRHRLFEANWRLDGPPCDHAWQTPRFRSLDAKAHKAGSLSSVVGVHGHCNYAGEGELRKLAMGIDWMSQSELAQAIPPAYTHHIGMQLAQLDGRQRALRGAGITAVCRSCKPVKP